MADDKTKKLTKGAEEEDEAGEEQTEAKAKSPKKLIIIFAVAVFALGALGGGGYFLYKSMNPAEAAPAGDVVGDNPQKDNQTNIFFSGFQTGIVNLAVNNESPFIYLKYGFDLELENMEVSNEIVAELPRLTGKVAGVMSNRDWNEISTQAGRERLAREVLDAINNELSAGECIGLYFTTFVAQ